MAINKSESDVDMFVNNLYIEREATDNFWLEAEKFLLTFIVKHLQKKHGFCDHVELSELLMLELSLLQTLIKADFPQADDLFNHKNGTCYYVFMNMKAHTLRALHLAQEWEAELDALGTNSATEKYLEMLTKAPAGARSLQTLETFVQARVSA